MLFRSPARATLAKATSGTGVATTGSFGCQLYAGQDELDRARGFKVDFTAPQNVSLLSVVNFPNGGTVEITCHTDLDGIEATGEIVALKVGALNP